MACVSTVAAARFGKVRENHSPASLHHLYWCYDVGVRTTVTLDPDTRLLVERAMRERGLSFKEAVNEAIRAGLGASASTPRTYTTPRDLGPPRVDLTKSLRLAADLEDDALTRRLAEGR
jgi:Arc/MetJ family transcription regulator